VEVVAVLKEAFSIQGRLRMPGIVGASWTQILRPLRISGFCRSRRVSWDGFDHGRDTDDTSWLKPKMALFCDSAQPWLAISHEMKSFPRMPS
jgi:hypothetical protein